MDKLQELKQIIELAKKYEYAANVVYFDFETAAPDMAREDEGDILDFLNNEAFKLMTLDKAKDLIVSLHDEIDKVSDPLDKILINNLYDDYLKTKNITPEFNLRMNKIFSKAYVDWLDAKKNNDFSRFAGSLQSIVDVLTEAVSLREKKCDDLYDTLLDDHEEGMHQAELDVFFDELKAGLIDLLGRIRKSKHVIRRDFLTRKVPVHKQAEFSDYLLKLNGYDFSRGMITTTEHPFTEPVGRNDARVTTHYYENMFVSNIFSVIHEGGHAIFMQNEPQEDYEHYLEDNIPLGAHESVSRFYENVIGRSKAYIHLIYPKFVELFGDIFPDVSEQELYEAVNIVEPSLIRTEADEVTYCLHVIIRYELEKLICAKAIKVEDIPAKWDQLYKEYLGIDVPSVSQGALQDVHWSGGFGYFPSYAMGNAYNAMYLKEFNKDHDLYDLVSKGDFATINKWMTDHVFAGANRVKPKEWIRNITGRDLTANDFIEYLNAKYTEIYRL